MRDYREPGIGGNLITNVTQEIYVHLYYHNRWQAPKPKRRAREPSAYVNNNKPPKQLLTQNNLKLKQFELRLYVALPVPYFPTFTDSHLRSAEDRPQRCDCRRPPLLTGQSFLGRVTTREQLLRTRAGKLHASVVNTTANGYRQAQI